MYYYIYVRKYNYKYFNYISIIIAFLCTIYFSMYIKIDKYFFRFKKILKKLKKFACKYETVNGLPENILPNFLLSPREFSLIYWDVGSQKINKISVRVFPIFNCKNCWNIRYKHLILTSYLNFSENIAFIYQTKIIKGLSVEI